MSPRLGPRLHKLPHRLDYTLIPPPLDLSLPLKTEKSALPAIIVTPSSPSSDRDFAIAFMAPPAKPTLRERVTSYTSSSSTKSSNFSLRARTMIIIFIIVVVLICHVVTHRLAAQRPHLEFSIQTGEGHFVEPASFNWFSLRSRVGANNEPNAPSTADNTGNLDTPATETIPVKPVIDDVGENA